MMLRSAVISPDGVYRYSLTRKWRPAGQRFVAWIMLNPSTADGQTDDPTIRRCIRFAQDWGYDGMEVVNLYAYRATDPKDLPHSRLDAMGPLNDIYVLQALGAASLCMAAWGAHPAPEGTGRLLRRPLQRGALYCLGTTKDGHPRHPLYMARRTLPRPWSGA